MTSPISPTPLNSPRAWLYAIFCLSGACGLGCQMVWTRLFAFGLGHELPSVLAVVAAFFGGLAVGAWLLDGPVGRSARPGRWYAGLELVIGAWGLVSIALIPLANESALRWIGAESQTVRHWAVVFGVPFVVLLPATLAMGATLPAMERFVAPLVAGGRCVGALYAFNTLGAVAGTMLAAFVVLPALGFTATLWVFAALNLLCGAAVLLFEPRVVLRSSRREEAHLKNSKLKIQNSKTPASLLTSAATKGGEGFPRWRLLVAVFLTGLLGIGYEVLGVRVMAEVLEGTIYSFAAVLSVYLFGTAAGAGFYQRLGARFEFRSLLSGLTLGLSSSCLLGALGLSKAQAIYEAARGALGDSVAAVLGAEMTVATAVFGLPTLLMGATFSHLVQAARGETGGVGRAVSLNTLGSALAPAVFGVWLLPALGAKWALVVLALGYLALLPLALRSSDRSSRRKEAHSSKSEIRNLKSEIEVSLLTSAATRRRRNVALAFGLLLPLVLVFALPKRLQHVTAPPGGAVLGYRQGVMDSVAVVKHFDGNRSLLVNNRFVMGGTGAAGAAKRHAHLPLLLHPNPRRALFLGLGTGITFSAAREHPGLDAEGVELVPEVLAAAHHFEPHSAAWLTSTNLHAFVADARRFVRVTDRRYDLIVADLFHPARDGAGALYTREHFQAMRERLAPGGLLCQWLPLYQLDEAMLRVITRTFLEVFPHARAFLLRLNVDTPVLGLIGWLEPAKYPPGWLARRVGEPVLVAALKPLSLVDDLQLFGGYLADAETLHTFARGAPLNTDDHPVVVFEAPRFAYDRTATSYGRMLALLDLRQPDLSDLIDEGADASSPTFSERLAHFITARDRYLRGLVAEVEGRKAEALDAFVGSARLSPDFTTGYAHCLTLVSQQAQSNPAAARELLRRLSEARPERGVAQEMLKRLAGQ
ncbi:MAG: fused MFS/spermidine synthase [Verrucomicrobia bacterium]|nr:fused MFS/spermidine synthase [Verrucomicrobiota bacterium]